MASFLGCNLHKVILYASYIIFLHISLVEIYLKKLKLLMGFLYKLHKSSKNQLATCMGAHEISNQIVEAPISSTPVWFTYYKLPSLTFHIWSSSSERDPIHDTAVRIPYTCTNRIHSCSAWYVWLDVLLMFPWTVILVWMHTMKAT